MQIACVPFPGRYHRCRFSRFHRNYLAAFRPLPPGLDGAGPAKYATGSMSGTEKKLAQRRVLNRGLPDARQLADGIREGSRTALARAITLVESSRADHQDVAQALLAQLLPDTGKAVRLGLSGAPGVG